MSDFCPDGYEPAPEAVERAALHWFAEQFEKIEKTRFTLEGAVSQDPIAQAVQAFSSPQAPSEWTSIANETVHRLRNFLHRGELHADYFDGSGRHAVPRDFWATAEADGVLVAGIYWPFGKPSRTHELRPQYRLFLRQSELEGLLGKEASKRRQFPRSKMPDLEAALQKFDHLPNRAAQLEALRELPEFRGYKITHAIFREVAKRLPREPGHRQRGES